MGLLLRRLARSAAPGQVDGIGDDFQVLLPVVRNQHGRVLTFAELIQRIDIDRESTTAFLLCLLLLLLLGRRTYGASLKDFHSLRGRRRGHGLDRTGGTEGGKVIGSLAAVIEFESQEGPWLATQKSLLHLILAGSDRNVFGTAAL